MFASAFKSFTSNIAANYEISKQPSANVGPWTIFDAKKKGTGVQVSVFVFKREVLEVSANGFGARTSATSVKKAQEEVIERLKKEASSLARLRHPSILQLVEPVEETRSGGLMFATEAVIGSLSAALSQKDANINRSHRGASDGAKAMQDIELDELEIQKGLLQVAKGLEFLHDSAKLVHGNLTPDAIFINAKSDWKISGLAFAGPPDGAEGHQTMTQMSLSEALYHDARTPATVQLNIDYTSPDFVLDSNINASADIFSLGLVLLACYDEPHRSPLETHGNQSTYKKIFSSASTTPSQHNNYLCSKALPQELEQTLPRMLARRPAGRMTASEFQQSEYFDNILVNTMRFLDAFPTKTPVEKSQFMKGLSRVMPQFPKSVLEKKILSVLLEEMKDRELLAPILQNIFMIVKIVPSPREVLCSKVLPKLKDVFLTKAKSEERDTSKEAGLVITLENLRSISENCTAQQFKEDVLPIVHVAMQSATHSLVDAALNSLSIVLPVLDFSTVKHDLFPVIANVFTKTSSLGIKVRGLEALGVLCGASDGNTASNDDDFPGTHAQEPSKKNVSSLDKFTMQEKVVPLLKGIKTKEPAVMMASLKVFQQIARAGDSEFLASEVMPILWSFALGPLLDLNQFKAYMDLIKGVSAKIEREQIRKLQDLSTGRSSETRAKAASPVQPTLDANAPNGKMGIEDDFERLVLSKKVENKNDPFAGAMSDGQKLVQNAPSFSWSTTSGGTTPALRPGTLQPQPVSRSITPDVTMSAFRSLQPAPISSASAWSQPLQPTSSTQSSSIWGQPMVPSPSPASVMQPLQASNFFIPPPPSSTPNAWQGQSSSNAWTLPSPPSVTNNLQVNYGARPILQSRMSQTSQPQQKTGLDKYESLL